MGNVRIDPLLKEFGSVLVGRGKRCYLVGGAVRDLLRGERPADWDVATDASPQEVIAAYRKVIPTGLKHGTVTVLFKGHPIETTTFRTESGYSNARHPDSVSYVSTIEEDLSRRDFTMNAIAADIVDGGIVDPFGGAADIRRRLIRCVGDPAERFDEDGLRPLRAIRLACQLEFSIDDATFAAIPGALDRTAMVAKERVREELERMLGTERPSEGFRLMERSGLLALLFPELAACRGVEQKGFHRFDVLDHLLLSCDGAPRGRSDLRLAALLHDVGKPSTAALDDAGIWTFYHHEAVSAKIAEAFMRRYRYPTATMKTVIHLIEQHMFHYQDEWSDAAVRRFVARVGEDNLEDLYALRVADAYGTAGARPSADPNRELRSRVEQVLAAGQALTMRDLAVSGNDLADIGIPAGKRMGAILRELLDTVLSDPEMNTRDRLLDVARGLEARFGSADPGAGRQAQPSGSSEARSR